MAWDLLSLKCNTVFEIILLVSVHFCNTHILRWRQESIDVNLPGVQSFWVFSKYPLDSKLSGNSSDRPGSYRTPHSLVSDLTSSWLNFCRSMGLFMLANHKVEKVPITQKTLRWNSDVVKIYGKWNREFYRKRNSNILLATNSVIRTTMINWIKTVYCLLEVCELKQ